MNEYTKQAKDFLKSTGAQLVMHKIPSDFTIRPLWAEEGKISHGHEYRVAIINKDGLKYVFNFWDSIANAQANKRPTQYDVLASLDTYTDESTSFDDFVAEYGYEVESVASYRKARRTWLACKKQTAELKRLFTSEQIEQLQEIN